MATILPFLTDQPVFNPDDIAAMSMALDDVCNSLGIGADKTAKKVIAIRIIELARRGERSPTKLRDHVLADANGDTSC
jgi:hypothetical protein